MEEIGRGGTICKNCQTYIGTEMTQTAGKEKKWCQGWSATVDHRRTSVLLKEKLLAAYLGKNVVFNFTMHSRLLLLILNLFLYEPSARKLLVCV